MFRGVPLRRSLIFLGQRRVNGRSLVSTFALGYVFVRLVVWDTFRLHELQGGTTSFGDLRLRSPPEKNLGSRLFQRFTARRASFGTILVMNSQEFMDVPDFRRGPRRSQSHLFRFTTRWDFRGPKAEASDATLPRGGLVGPRIAVGAEILGFTTAFLRGLGFFSLSSLTTHPTLVSGFYLAAEWTPSGTSAFAAAPFPR